VRLNVAVRIASIVAGVVVVVAGSLARAAEMGWSAYALIALGSVVLLLGLCGSIPINRNRRHGERLRPEDLHDELRSRFGQ
jgi:hypothetical protein